MQPPPFGLRLKELRQRAGLTQPQLAERAGMSLNGVALIEQGRREPVWSTVLALAAALGVNARAFLMAKAAIAKPQKRGRPKRAAGAKHK